MFSKMKSISIEFKAEIRRSIIQIFENIIVIHGDSFPEELWQIIFEDNLIVMIKLAVEVFNGRRENVASILEKSNTSGTRKKMAFDDDNVL